MACRHCDHKGFIDSVVARDAGLKPTLEQCPRCRDTKAYSDEVMRRQALYKQADELIKKHEPPPTPRGPRPTAQIIQFKRRNDK